MPASNLCRGDEASGLPLCLLVPFSGLFVTILVAFFLLVHILLPLPAWVPQPILAHLFKSNADNFQGDWRPPQTLSPI